MALSDYDPSGDDLAYQGSNYLQRGYHNDIAQGGVQQLQQMNQQFMLQAKMMGMDPNSEEASNWVAAQMQQWGQQNGIQRDAIDQFTEGPAKTLAIGGVLAGAGMGLAGALGAGGAAAGGGEGASTIGGGADPFAGLSTSPGATGPSIATTGAQGATQVAGAEGVGGLGTIGGTAVGSTPMDLGTIGGMNSYTMGANGVLQAGSSGLPFTLGQAGAGVTAAAGANSLAGGGQQQGGSPVQNSPLNLGSQQPGTGQNIMTSAGGNNVDYTGSGSAQLPNTPGSQIAIETGGMDPFGPNYGNNGGSPIQGSPFNVAPDGSVGNTSYGTSGMQGQGNSPFDVGTTTSGQDPLGGGGTVGTTIGGMPTGDGVQVGTGTAQTSGGLLDYLTNLGTGAVPGLITAGTNALVNGALGNRQNQQGTDLIQSNNPLTQTQRAPFQQAATNMVNNPGSYFQNNPFAQAFGNYMQNSVVPRSVASTGNVSNVIDRAGSQTAVALGQNYNQLLQTLQGFGGYNQQNPALGAGTALTQAGNVNTAGATQGFGNVISDAASKIFGTPSNPQQPQPNPVTGSTIQS